MANIQQSIRSLADQFVHGVLQALSTASLHELSALTGGSESSGGGRRASGPSASAPTASPARRAGRGASGGSVGPKSEGRGRRGGRRVRRSSEDVAQLASSVANYVSESKGNVAVSEIAKALGVSTTDITRPVAIALQEGKIYKTGEKRLTRYFPGGEGGKGRGRAKKNAA